MERKTSDNRLTIPPSMRVGPNPNIFQMVPDRKTHVQTFLPSVPIDLTAYVRGVVPQSGRFYTPHPVSLLTLNCARSLLEQSDTDI